MGLIALLPVIGELIDKVIPDPQKKLDYHLELQKLADQEAEREHQEALGQQEINKVEAAHRSLFVAGWRPFVGWVGGGSLLYATIIAPAFHLGVPDIGFLQTILLAILGIGGMRSFDKAKGTSNDAPLVVRHHPVEKQPVEAVESKPRKKSILPFDIPGIGRI
jgi:hypothetical protein